MLSHFTKFYQIIPKFNTKFYHILVNFGLIETILAQFIFNFFPTMLNFTNFFLMLLNFTNLGKNSDKNFNTYFHILTIILQK